MEQPGSLQDGHSSRDGHFSDTYQLDHTRYMQDHLLTILEHIYDSFCVLDRDWRYMYLNRRAEELLGRKREEVLGRSHWEVFPEAIKTIFYTKLHEAMDNQTPITFEAIYAPSNRWYAVYASPSPIGLAIYSHDITAQKQVEVQRLYQTQITGSISDALIVTDMQYIILSWNQAAEVLYGWKAEEVIGKNALDVVPGIFQTDSSSIFQHVMATRGTWRGEVLQQHKDGTKRYVLASVSLIKDQAGNIIGMMTANRDNAERNRIEEGRKHLLHQLQVERSQLEAVLQQMPSGVIIAEAPSGKLVMGNKKVEDIWRHPFIEASGVGDYTSYQGFHADGRRYTAEEWPLARSILYGETVHAEEITYMRGDSSRGIIQVSSAPVRDQHGDIVAGVVIFTDITEQKEIEQRKDDFISIASHELKTPLTTVKVLAQLLKKMAARQRQNEMLQSLSRMEEQIDRLARLITDLLDVSTIQNGQVNYREERIAVDNFVREVTEDFQRITPSHGIIVNGSTGRLIVGDRERLEQVVMNLLNNAIKYAPHARRVDILLSSDERHAIIRVRDYGNGIAPEHLQHLFDRFYRVHSTHKRPIAGLGMGLYIASEIIRHHGGTLTVESEVGKGTTFSVTLPSITV